MPAAGANGPVGLWDGEVRGTSFDHDANYDNP